MTISSSLFPSSTNAAAGSSQPSIPSQTASAAGRFGSFLYDSLKSTQAIMSEQTSSGFSPVSSSLFLNPVSASSYFSHLDDEASRNPAEPAAKKVKKETAAASENPSSSKQASGSGVVQTIERLSEKYGVDSKLVRALVKQESGFNPNAKSHAGAMGLMQLMPGTASMLKVKDPMDPEQNLDGGIRYLRDMLDKYNGNKTLALAAYNAGPGNVDKYDGIPPFKETQKYVPNVLANYQDLV
ncbi:lytic transglycosylase domain-containing protein [Marinococcus luteus]|uniref:lytic transglycosylase domain-containing protein n=1 Tax=Marinococcus luteus TaxID=1122204 RepID=UPI002ACCB1A7|nr:lytic transglycosylase domain-containing protein [Marinococcus luteus]MDZ5783634.1 lytic transglycosylase domain-containing protein [Marinococcus luteus]